MKCAQIFSYTGNIMLIYRQGPAHRWIVDFNYRSLPVQNQMWSFYIWLVTLSINYPLPHPPGYYYQSVVRLPPTLEWWTHGIYFDIQYFHEACYSLLSCIMISAIGLLSCIVNSLLCRRGDPCRVFSFTPSSSPPWGKQTGGMSCGIGLC